MTAIMSTKTAGLITAFLMVQVYCKGFEFTYRDETLSAGAATTDGPDQACGVLHCTESSSGTRTLSTLTVYRRDRFSTQDGGRWEQLTTVTQSSPNVDTSSDGRRIKAELNATRGEVEVELSKAEDCNPSGLQYSCVAFMADGGGRTTLVKSVLGAEVDSNSDANLEWPDPGTLKPSNNLLSAAEKPGDAKNLEPLVTALLEKVECIKTRLEDSQKMTIKLKDKTDSMEAAVIDKIHNLERFFSDKFMFSETRADEKMGDLREKLEEMLQVSVSKCADRAISETSQKLCPRITLSDEVIGSIKSIQGNVTGFSKHMHDVEAAVLDSSSKATAMDSKLGKLVSSVDGTSALSSQLVETVTSLTGICRRKPPAHVDEYFDLSGHGRKEWRLAFRGTAYNNVDIYTAYLYGTGIPADVEVGCKQFNHSLLCANHYRNRDALENWKGIDEVLFAVYVKDKMVKNIVFTGTGSTFTSWFSPNRVLQSSWSDVATLSHNIFSIQGFTWSKAMRRFYVNHFHKSCDTEKGWFMASTTIPGHCKYEWKLAHPLFLYAKGGKAAQWSSTSQVGKADAFGIFIKYL